MSNPVLTKLEKEWATQPVTPNGYPMMPGYAPGRNAASAPDSASSDHLGGACAAAEDSFAHMEQSFAAPSADAVDRGRMTYDDVIVKSGLCLAVLLLGAFASWMAFTATPAIGAGLMTLGLVGGFILAMVNSFSRTIRPALVLAYAGAEGLALGGVSAAFESIYPGIIIQALLATAAVFTVTLLLFASGTIRNSSRLMKFTLIGLVGILVYRLVATILAMTGLLSSHLDSTTVMGIPLGLIVGLLAVLIGAFSLVQDFDQVKLGVQRGVPARYAWACAFGILVTVVWMYLEIVRILAILRDN